MRRLRHWPWMVLVMGPLCAAVILYGLQLMYVLLMWAVGLTWSEALAQSFKPAQKFAWGWQLLVAVIWGFVRLSSHPIKNASFRKWLLTTPWDASKPLPVGDVHVRLADWAVVLVWMGLAYLIYGQKVLYLPLAFLCAYLTSLMSALFRTDEEGATLFLAFGLAGVLRLWEWPLAALALSLLLHSAGYFGLRRSLKRFPWDIPEPPLVTQYGWPLDRLSPKRQERQISFWSAIAVSLLVAWWVYAAMSHLAQARITNRVALTTALWIAAIGTVAGLIRLGIYVTGHASPITLRGRIRTGRLIIPTHDSAWWAAILVPLISAAIAYAAVQHLRLQTQYAVPTAVFAMLLAALALPPSRRWYQLTGEHRLISGPQLEGDFSPDGTNT